MITDGHEVFIVTAASVYQTLPAKMDWFFGHYPYLGWENIVIAHRKQIVQGDVLIDDGVHNLVGGDYFKLLYDCPNNRAYDAGGNGMVRVYSLKEAYEVINKELL
jgi:5'(3')-deoxyribonucleotidase